MALGTTIRKSLAPGIRNSNWAYRSALEQCVSRSDRWLDVGCGHQLLPGWMDDAQRDSARLIQGCRTVVGVDRFHEALVRHSTIDRRVAADIGCLPFRRESFDLVTANMVVEHVEHPERVLAEVARVLVPQGVFLFHTPNKLFYQVLCSALLPSKVRSRAASLIEGRAADDVFPTHYRMNTRRTIQALARASGLTVEHVSPVNSSLITERFGPFVLAELAIAKVLESEWAASGRSNLIVTLRKW